MKKRFVLVAASILLASSPVPAPTAGPCDRACLEGAVDRFLDAFVKHDPAQAGLARTVTFTENGQRRAVGDGSWRTMTGKGAYRLFVSDPQAGRVAFIGTLRAEHAQNGDGALVLIALHPKVERRQISEVELFVVRSENAAKNVEKLDTPHHLILRKQCRWPNACRARIS